MASAAAGGNLNGAVISHYRVVDRLGEGGMGEVYRAEDVRLGREVALKLLHPARQADPDHRARLMREARAAAMLRASATAAIFDIGEHEGRVFIAMELVNGESLARRLERGPLPLAEAIDIAMQVADALDEAHGQGVVHRDIKSANLMIDSRGRVKVLDFGLAKLPPVVTRADDRTMTQLDTVAGTVLGTFSYMAPEQALGRVVDGRADLFSLGVVLYEMVAGRLPFEGATVTEVLDRILHQEPAPLTRFTYDVPPQLEAVVRKALAKDPNYRYQSARELYIDLHGVQRSLEQAQATRASSTNALALRDPSSGSLPEPIRLERSVAVMTFTNITGEPGDEWIGNGIAETVTADLKTVKGLAVIGRGQILDVLKNVTPIGTDRLDDRLALVVGRQLGATWIIAGGYQRLGDLIRITAQFVEVATGNVMKTVKLDGRIDQIFELQDRIVYELGQGLHLAIDDTMIEEIARHETYSVEAYEAFSRGMMNLRMASRESLERSIAHFERAVQRDPGYAWAWGALGAATLLKGNFLNLLELKRKAVELLRRSVELDPRLPSAHYWLGNAYASIGEHDRGIEAIREAIRLEPANAGAHLALARTYWFAKGQIDEGITELEQAVRLNPEAGYGFLQLSLLYALRGDYKRAEKAARKAVDLQEQYMSGSEGLQIVGAHLRLGYVFYLQGRYDEAVREYERELAFLGSGDHVLRERTTIEVHQKMSAAFWRKGDRDEADRHYRLVVSSFAARVAAGAGDPSTQYYVASLHALRGEVDEALRHLADSIASLRPLSAVRARLDPDFDPIRGLPAFDALVSSTELTPSRR